MEQEINRGFFNLEGATISKTMRSAIGALTVIEAKDISSIIAAHCGWDLTIDEARYFTTLVESVKILQKNTLSSRDFALSTNVVKYPASSMVRSHPQ